MRSVATHGFRRKKPTPVWQTLNGLLTLLIAGAVGAILFFFFQPELAKLQEMQRRYGELETNRNLATVEQLRLSREKELLKTDPEFLENVARDKLDLMKPGETIFRLDGRPGPSDGAGQP